MTAQEPPTGSPLSAAAEPPRVVRLREDAVLFYFTHGNNASPSLELQQRVWALAAWLEARREELGLREIVPGMGNLLLAMAPLPVGAGLVGSGRANEFQPPTQDPHTLIEQTLALWPTLIGTDIVGRVIEIPVEYGEDAGPDLKEVSAHTGLEPEEIISRHCAAKYRVYCLGFQPGFAYLGGLDPSLATPRRATPRLAIPAGSVAIGGVQSAIYPSTTPGGWQVIGRTELKMFDAGRASPSLLMPGDTVRFVRSGGDS